MKIGKTNEYGNVIMTANKTKMAYSKYKNYEALVPNERDLDYTYIIGYEVKKPQHKENLKAIIKDNVIIEDMKILESIITLADNIFRLEKPIEKEVIKWCKKYGMPFTGGHIIEEIDEMLKIYDAIGYIGFSLDMFIDLLWDIYGNYLAYATIENDYLIDIDNLTVSTNTNNEKIITHTNRSKKLIINLNHKNKEIERLLNSINIKYEFKFVNDKLTSIPKIENILSLAIYQLGLLMLSKNEMHAKLCECCMSLFNASRKNQKFCSECSPQKNYIKNKRNFQKGGAS